MSDAFQPLIRIAEIMEVAIKKRAAYNEFQVQCWELLKAEFHDKLVLSGVAAFSPPGRASNRDWSFPIELTEDDWMCIKISQKKGYFRSSHTPDYGVFEHNSVLRFWHNKKRVQYIDSDTDWRNRHLFKKTMCWNVFDEGYPTAKEIGFFQNDKRRGNHNAVFVKENAGLIAVGDAKYPLPTTKKPRINFHEIQKLIVDAKLLFADRCFLVAPMCYELPKGIHVSSKSLGELPEPLKIGGTVMFHELISPTYERPKLNPRNLK